MGFKIDRQKIVFLLIGVGIGIFIYSLISAWRAGGVFPTKGASQRGYRDKLELTMDIVDHRYVDEISRDSLSEHLIPELIKRLDPHSEYIPASRLEQVNEPLAGEFDGIGVMFNTMTDTALITNVITGGPSHKAGVVAGDRIMRVNDSLVAGIKLANDSLIKKLRGKRGTKVTIGVLRSGAENGELTKIEITRGVIPMKSLDAAFLIEDSIAFIRFTRFAMTTYRELMEAMADLTAKGAKRVVIDMRGNSGGYLDQAIYICNEFLEKDQGIVYTEGLHSPRREQLASGSGKYKSIPLTMLIDEGSASASEILAGAIQDNDRGLIVGRRSFGKGLVQEQLPYSDGSALRITIARYYTPVGRSIQKPYKLGESEEYHMELMKRAVHDELFNVDSIKQDESLKFQTPGGKIVYGGGGIMPDIFVPIDTTGVSQYFKALFEKNLIFKYATKITEENRGEINNITSFAELEQFFAKRNLYEDFVKYTAQNGVISYKASGDRNRSLIIAQLKGFIGRNTVLEDSAYFFYFYPEDKTAMEALSAIKSL